MMVRIDRCSRIERRIRDLAAYRAIEFWDLDQKLEVETLALQIQKQPGKTVAKLRQTPAGCDWLLARWRFLAKLDPQAWTDQQRSLAGSLVGNDPILDPSAPGFAAEQVAELEVLRERVEEADEIARGLVEADLSDDIPSLSRAPALLAVVAPADEILHRPVLRRAPRPLGRPQPQARLRRPGVHQPRPRARVDLELRRARCPTNLPKRTHYRPSRCPESPKRSHYRPSRTAKRRTKPLKPMHRMTADELEANFPPETFVCQSYHNEKIKAVDRPSGSTTSATPTSAASSPGGGRRWPRSGFKDQSAL